MKIKKNKLLLTTIILTIAQIAIIGLSAIALGFDLFGIRQMIEGTVKELYAGQMDMDGFVTSFYIESLFIVFINIMVLVRYIRGYRYNANSPAFGRHLIWNSVSQFLFSSYIPAIFALITGLKLISKKPSVAAQENMSNEQAYYNQIKFEAMSQAVTRLKELRDSGAISEEEYYANLNKILES